MASIPVARLLPYGLGQILQQLLCPEEPARDSRAPGQEHRKKPPSITQSALLTLARAYQGKLPWPENVDKLHKGKECEAFWEPKGWL